MPRPDSFPDPGPVPWDFHYQSRSGGEFFEDKANVIISCINARSVIPKIRNVDTNSLEDHMCVQAAQIMIVTETWLGKPWHGREIEYFCDKNGCSWFSSSRTDSRGGASIITMNSCITNKQHRPFKQKTANGIAIRCKLTNGNQLIVVGVPPPGQEVHC